MELTIQLALQQGIAAHKEGRLQEAERLYRSILQAQPTHYKALNNLGAILLKLGRLDEAELSFKKAIEYKTEFEVAYYNLGIVLEKLDRLEEAEER